MTIVNGFLSMLQNL